MQINQIGVVIADDMEFLPLKRCLQQRGVPQTTGQAWGCELVSFRWDGAQVTAVQCGIGKANAAAAAAFLIAGGAQVLLNIGLSGAVAPLRRGQLVLGETYLETDFDVTPLGYPPYRKPGQAGPYRADEALLAAFCTRFSLQKGLLGSGDFFLTDPAKKQRYLDELSVLAFDMESGAIAAVCDKCGVPFLSLRQISDGADGESKEEYREFNDRAEQTLAQTLLEGISHLLVQ